MYRREFIRLLVGAVAGIFAEEVVAEEILSEEDLATAAEALDGVARSAEKCADGFSGMMSDLEKEYAFLHGSEPVLGFVPNGLLIIDDLEDGTTRTSVWKVGKSPAEWEKSLSKRRYREWCGTCCTRDIDDCKPGALACFTDKQNSLWPAQTYKCTPTTKLGPVHIQYVTPASNHKCEICGRPAQHHLHDMREVKSEGEYRVWEHVGPAHSYCDEHISESDPRDGLVKAWT